MKAILSSLALIAMIIFLVLLMAGQMKMIHQYKYAVLYFLFYFIDNLAIALANHYLNLQITPNHLWEGFLLWGLSGKIYSIVSVLFLLCAIRSSLPFEEIGLTIRQHQGSIVPSSVIIFLIALGSSAIGALSPKGRFDLGLLLYLAILPGLNEELVYRGVLPACLDKFLPTKWDFASAKIGWSAIITTALFGLLHGLWLDDHFELHVEIVWIRNAMLSGIIFAWLKERTGSLIMPILAHGAWDFFLFLPRMI